MVYPAVKHSEYHHYLEVSYWSGVIEMRKIEQTPQQQQVFKIVSSLSALLVVIVAVYFKDQMSRFSQWGYIGVFIVSLIGNATILMPLPILVTVGAIGVSLNPFVVGAIASLGAALGESVGYFLGLAGSIVVQKTDKYDKAMAYIRKYGFWGIFLLASFPNPLFDLSGIIAGATGMKYKQFFIAAWAGTCIKYTLISVIGYRLFS